MSGSKGTTSGVAAPLKTCGPANPVLSGPVSFAAAMPQNTAMWGSTPAVIKANFAYNVFVNASTNAGLDASFSGMDNIMLARLSTELAANDHAGYTPTILAYAASKLSVANLVRLASAFGPTLVNQAVASSAPASVRAGYNGTPPSAALTISQYAYASGQPRMPELGDMSPYDVLLLAQTQSGNTSNAVALATTLRYMHNSVPGAVNGIMVVQGKGSLPGCNYNALTGAFCSIVAILQLLDPDYPAQTQAALDWIHNTILGWWNTPNIPNYPVVSCIVADCPPPFPPTPPLGYSLAQPWNDIPFTEDGGSFDVGGSYVNLATYQPD